MTIKTVIYDPKTLKGKEKSNKVLVSKENAEGRGKIVPFFYLPHIPRFRSLWRGQHLSFLIQIQNLIMINFGIDALVNNSEYGINGYSYRFWNQLIHVIPSIVKHCEQVPFNDITYFTSF